MKESVQNFGTFTVITVVLVASPFQLIEEDGSTMDKSRSKQDYSPEIYITQEQEEIHKSSPQESSEY